MQVVAVFGGWARIMCAKLSYQLVSPTKPLRQQLIKMRHGNVANDAKLYIIIFEASFRQICDFKLDVVGRRS